MDEVKELGKALKSNSKRELENEFADVIAWLASLANVTKVDLQKATLDKYDNKCPPSADARHANASFTHSDEPHK